MTDLEYIQMRLAEGSSVEREHDLARAREERSIAIRSFFAGRGHGLRNLLSAILGKVTLRHANALPKVDLARQ